jgi:hypothetical protein
MGKFTYIIAIFFIVLWVIGFFIYSIGAIIHLFLLLALITILFRIIQTRNFDKNSKRD